MAYTPRQWLSEIQSSMKREKDFRKEGMEILELYDGEKDSPFNILFSNTETIGPALYSATPRPVVQRRFKDDDPIGKASAEAGKRMLEFLMDTNIDGYETFDEGVRGAVLDALLPGRGVTAVKYDADLADMERGEAEGEQDAEPTQYKKSELVCVDKKPWDRVFFGYAKKWSKVPWVAYREYIDRDEAIRLFGVKIASELNYTSDTDEDDKEEKKPRSEDEQGETKTTPIFQVWDKKSRTLIYLSPQKNDKFLKVEDDPLGLTGFFNCPQPLQFVEKSHDLTPTPLYRIYENQARELNEISRRINRVVRAIKAKAIYDTELGDDIKNLIEADDNEFVPAETPSSLAAEKGLDNALWFWPVDKLIAVLQQLMVAREQCKQVIYEIIGIADILRGASKASETLGAQQIKERWGGLRIKVKQKEVQRYTRDILRMMLEIAALKFSQETWAKCTGLPYLTDEKKAELEQMVQAMKQQYAQMQITGQQPNPQQVQQFQQLQGQLQAPTWSAVLGLLKDDMQRAYRIDIETNSTIEPEAAEDQKNIADLMNALAQYLNGVGPLVAQGILPFQTAQSMLLAITRRFRFGDEVEDYIRQMQPPKQEDTGAAEREKMQAEMQARSAELQQQGQLKQAELQQTAQTEAQRLQAEAQAAQMEAQQREAESQRNHEREIARIRADKEALLSKLQSERVTKRLEAEMEQDTELKKAAIQAAAQIQIAQVNAAAKAASAGEENAREERTEARSEAANAKIIEALLQTQAELLRAISGPKKIERDAKTGLALKIVPG